MVSHSSLNDFYQGSGASYPEGVSKDIGHFNVFEAEKLFDKVTGNRTMPYSRRDYYKVSWIRGKSTAEYADKVIDIPQNALLFATPKIPYHWLPADGNQTGMFCIFTSGFLDERKSGVVLDELPIFQPGQVPVFPLSPEESAEVEYLFRKMHKELASDYAFKYDLLRNLLLELIHFGQKLQPVSVLSTTQNASQRIVSLFIELLERQFPLESPRQLLALRTAKDYATRLAVHVNHLNKVLKEVTGSTTTETIHQRILQEARVLLKQTSWTVADIAWSLGFDDVPHFSNFFKKHTQVTPVAFRQ
ncbi:AraC-type DNA-binding protein [Filimonas lacunae]|uniref:AraC-type DNA-binding protein n=1 Tax=Filimonas lacunae TaxID=477680 RepID=A0A173MKM2_9BACT|nr:helix-turn-helix domain-containing protein [Filimonas lacunae]BAV07951.1 transcriptional regulator, AraC family [Filimonas lacunae]SIT07065.1 AraC-type DNA-binding protein [Filimonas lacunae]